MDAARGKALREHVVDRAKKAGWRIDAPRAVDLVLVKGERRYVVELKVAAEPRTERLQALLADAYLRARVAAEPRRAKPLAIVGASTISERMADALRAYGDRYLPGAYGFVDGSGRVEFHAEGLPIAPEGTALAVPRRPRRRGTFEPFSDRNQWLLKVLLARRIPEALLAAPRKAIASARQLAKVAEVSVPTAARLVAHLRHEAFLPADQRALELQRIEPLLDDWKHAAKSRSREVPARFVLATRQPEMRLREAMRSHGGSRMCLALFSAAEHLGYGHARGTARHVYADDVAAALKALGAIESAAGEHSDFVVRVPRTVESVFRGAVTRDGIPCTDVLQTWLDVASHRARGEEQAEHLWRRVIAPCVLRRSTP